VPHYTTTEEHNSYATGAFVAQIFVPTRSADDWKHLLAQPDLHWKPGYSAMTLARAWEHAATSGFPSEILAAILTANRPDWATMRLLLAIPEYKVPLPGGSRPSQTDLVALARAERGLVAFAVEGKVDESLGPTVGEKRHENSDGVNERLAFLHDVLGLAAPVPDSIRYQLLHRAVSAVQIAQDFAAESAVMLVHSFSPSHRWFEDFTAFARLFVGVRGGVPLYLGWCVGDQRFRGDSPMMPA
jgi:hypothetical protein